MNDYEILITNEHTTEGSELKLIFGAGVSSFARDSLVPAAITRIVRNAEITGGDKHKGIITHTVLLPQTTMTFSLFEDIRSEIVSTLGGADSAYTITKKYT